MILESLKYELVAPDAQLQIPSWYLIVDATFPQGGLRYTSRERIVPTAGSEHIIEVLLLRKSSETGSDWVVVSKRLLEAGVLKGASLEGHAVLDRRTYAIHAAGPTALPAPPDLEATLERTDDRIHVTRPAFLPDGSPAPFGREIAILNLGKPEAARDAYAEGLRLNPGSSQLRESLNRVESLLQ